MVYEEHSTVEEAERARELALMRKRGVLEPTSWLDVTSAYLRHYAKVREALVKAVGGYGNVKRVKEYPAEPLEAYYKIALTLEKPITAIFRLVDRDVLEFNGEQLPLFIDEKAYTPYNLRLYKFFERRDLQGEIETRRVVEVEVKDFYVQVDNPAWWSRLEERFVPRPGMFRFIIYE
ncbi:MAG: hypothetical protein QXO67_02740 [Candidatus Bathyarchaeia archaeon]